MLRPSLVIKQIRDECPLFDGRVAGALSFRKCREQDDFPAPHAFILPMEDVDDAEADLSPLDQYLTARFAVVVAVPNTSDEQGQDAGERLIDVRNELLAALIGFQPGENYAPILYAGMPDAIEFNRARAWAVFAFTSTIAASAA